MASVNTQCMAVGDCLTKYNLTDVRDLNVLISVDNLWKYEYGRVKGKAVPLHAMKAPGGR
jgi:hypothetical protein